MVGVGSGAGDVTRCDALVVGGGPAGLAAAIALRQQGVDVLVADSLRPPIDKACGEGLMPDARADLRRLGVDVSVADGAAFDGISFISVGGAVSARFPGGAGIGVRRLRLHTLLRERAEELGVRQAWGSRVSLEAGGQVRVQGVACSHRYLVGADGQCSRVRAWSGLQSGHVFSQRFGLRRHYRVTPWSGKVEVHWGERGQAYITPVGEQEVCVATMARSSREKLETIVAGMPTLAPRLQGRAAVGHLRGSVTTTRRLPRVTAGRVALAGDASGSADAITGEGMALSFRQAVLLGEAIAQDDLAVYEAGHDAILRLPQTMARILLAMDRWPWFRDRALRMLAADPELFASMIAVHLGEQPLSGFLLRSGLHVALRLALPPAYASPERA